jgi:hypothetical protein
MAGLVPAIHVFLAWLEQGVDARHPTPVYAEASPGFLVLGRRSFSEGGKAGHDNLWPRPAPSLTHCEKFA